MRPTATPKRKEKSDVRWVRIRYRNVGRGRVDGARSDRWFNCLFPPGAADPTTTVRYFDLSRVLSLCAARMVTAVVVFALAIAVVLCAYPHRPTHGDLVGAAHCDPLGHLSLAAALQRRGPVPDVPRPRAVAAGAADVDRRPA